MIFWQSDEEFGVQTVPRDGKGGVLGDPALPGQSLGLLEKLVKAHGLKAAQLQQHPLAGAQTEVGPGQHRLVAGEIDPAVFGGDLLGVHAAQLLRRQTLQAEETGDAKLMIHKYLDAKN